MEAEHLEDVVADEAVFVIENPEAKWTLHIYQNGDLACYGRDGTTIPLVLGMIVNRLPALIGAAGQLGFDEAVAMMEAEKKRRNGETIAEYVARINKEAAEERRKWAEVKKANTGETREKERGG